MKNFYKKYMWPIFLVAGGTLFLSVAFGANLINNPSAPTISPELSPVISPTPSTGLSNNNYYINVNGNRVHSPAYSNNGSVPVGATAQCSDGTYSFSQHRQGTCSHHGGVLRWLY